MSKLKIQIELLHCFLQLATL